MHNKSISWNQKVADCPLQTYLLEEPNQCQTNQIHLILLKRAKVIFKKVKRSDSIKDKYCKDNGIKLIRIPYTKIKDIGMILKEKI